jgi:hypothetical protein
VAATDISIIDNRWIMEPEGGRLAKSVAIKNAL